MRLRTGARIMLYSETESSGIRPFKFQVALLSTQKTGIQSPWPGKMVYLKTNILKKLLD